MPQYSLPAATVWRDALVGQPQALGRCRGLPEDVDRHAAARVPIAADPEPARFERLHQTLGDPQGAVLVKGALVAKRAEIKLERF